MAKEGRKVQVIDRRSDGALETTYANGGRISVSHADPRAPRSAAAGNIFTLYSFSLTFPMIFFNITTRPTDRSVLQ
jgi:hypothetical protein